MISQKDDTVTFLCTVDRILQDQSTLLPYTQKIWSTNKTLFAVHELVRNNYLRFDSKLVEKIWDNFGLANKTVM